MVSCACVPEQEQPTKHELPPRSSSGASLWGGLCVCLQSAFRLSNLDEGNATRYWAPTPVRSRSTTSHLRARSRATPRISHAKWAPKRAAPPATAPATADYVGVKLAEVVAEMRLPKEGGPSSIAHPPPKEVGVMSASPLQTPLTKLRKKPLTRPMVPWDQPLDPKLAEFWNEPCGTDLGLGLKLKDVLRHKALAEGLQISSDGWMKIEEALRYVNRFEPSTYDEAGVRREIAVNHRFQLKEDPKRGPFIRAVRGHTMKGVSTGASDTARSAGSAKSSSSTAKSDDTKRSNSPRGPEAKKPQKWVPATPRPLEETIRDLSKPLAKSDFRDGYINYFRLLAEAEEEAWVQANGPRKTKEKGSKGRVAF